MLVKTVRGCRVLTAGLEIILSRPVKPQGWRRNFTVQYSVNGLCLIYLNDQTVIRLCYMLKICSYCSSAAIAFRGFTEHAPLSHFLAVSQYPLVNFPHPPKKRTKIKTTVVPRESENIPCSNLEGKTRFINSRNSNCICSSSGRFILAYYPFLPNNC